MPEVYVLHCRPAIVDLEDLPVVSPYSWRRSRTSSTLIYAMTKIAGKTVYMHNLIMGQRDGLLVDHIDRDGLNNIRQNLRWVTNQQNNWNRAGHSDASCRYKGVRPQQGRWVASIYAEGVSRHIGMFTTAWEAAQAYNEEAKKHFGEYAFLNTREM